MPNNIDKDTIDLYLKEVAKRYKKKTKGRMPAEITIVGGAALLLNYGFRGITADIDAIIDASDYMNDAIAEVATEYGLHYDWLNDDFRKTSSFSHKLRNVSEYYRTYANCVEFRTVPGKYLVAMKLISGRPYKHDRSDVAGIIREERARGYTITYNEILSAVKELYGEQTTLTEESQLFLQSVLSNQDLPRLEQYLSNEETQVRESLIEFDKQYPNAMSSDNVLDIIDNLQKNK